MGIITGYQRVLRSRTSNINWVNSLLNFLFVGTLILTIFEIDIYRNTIIHWTRPTFLWLLTGSVLTPLLRNFLNKNLGTNSLLLQLIFNVVTWGGMVMFGFMATNFYFPINDSQTLTTNIVDTGHLARGRNGCGNPWGLVVINGVEKQLIFSCDIKIENYRSIDLTVKTGFWAFDIIIAKRLVDKT